MRKAISSTNIKGGCIESTMESKKGALMPRSLFSVKACWMLNLEGRLPEIGLDDTYIMLLRQANLDAMGGRAVATIERHACTVIRMVGICQ